MRKDSHQYAKSGGWGYALYGVEGGSKTEDIEAKEGAACFACHAVVKDRDYVFSRPAFFLVQKTKSGFKQTFDSTKWANLSALAQTALHTLGPESPSEIKSPWDDALLRIHR